MPAAAPDIRIQPGETYNVLLPSSAAGPVTVTRLLSTRTTASGQPIALPQRDVRLVVSRVVIAPGTTLPTHKHPPQRYGYVLAGTRQTFDYGPGDFIVEARNAWHSGTAGGGDGPVVLLVIDQVEAGDAGNMTLQDAR